MVDGMVSVDRSPFDFLEEESPVFPTYDVANSGASTSSLGRTAVYILTEFVRKKTQEEQVERVLKDWRIKIKDLEEKKKKKKPDIRGKPTD